MAGNLEGKQEKSETREEGERERERCGVSSSRFSFVSEVQLLPLVPLRMLGEELKEGSPSRSPSRLAMSPPQQQALRHSRIAKLDESVVNKIAAGEVIQRPHNALKEILENAIDAGADRITVVVRDGGNRSIQVQDNGSGIHKEDLALLCERHATSKLTDFEDLRNMQTLGFRGEALCSISYVAHLTVTTMTEGDTHATKTVYRNSTIEDGPKACAGKTN